MSAAAQSIWTRDLFKSWSLVDCITLLARLSLGVLFICMGLNKAMHASDFLKFVRQYDVLHAPLALNLVAAAMPWFEVFCGLLLLLGVAVRGSALMLAAMLVTFTTLIFLRALALREAGGLPFCMIKFDCGCGSGEVFVCGKLVDNLGLLAASIYLLFPKTSRLSLRHSLRGTARLKFELQLARRTERKN